MRDHIQAGTEELVPAAVADRLIDGESPLKVWRGHRALSQSALARASGVNRVQVATSRPTAPPDLRGPCAPSPTPCG